MQAETRDIVSLGSAKCGFGLGSLTVQGLASQSIYLPEPVVKGLQNNAVNYK